MVRAAVLPLIVTALKPATRRNAHDRDRTLFPPIDFSVPSNRHFPGNRTSPWTRTGRLLSTLYCMEAGSDPYVSPIMADYTGLCPIFCLDESESWRWIPKSAR